MSSAARDTSQDRPPRDVQVHGKPFLRVKSTGGEENSRSSAKRKGGGGVHVALGGELSRESLPKIWRKAYRSLRQFGAGRVELDATELTCADSACVALVSEVRRLVARAGGQLNIVGLSPDLQALIESATLPDPLAPELNPPASLGFVTTVGESTDSLLDELKALVTFIGQLCAGLIWAATHPREVRWREFLNACERAGADAVPVVLVLGFLIGVMLAFQSAEQTERYGVRTVVPSVVAIAVTRELGPLITALLLAGRTASAYAAELGTMKINDELSALETMGLDPVRFLAVPRVLAVVIVAPVLTMFCNLAAVLGGYSVMAAHGYSFVLYITQVRNAAHWQDLFGGLGKTVVCGLLIGAVGCLRGMRAGGGPRDVGHGTTKAVVISILLLVAVDGAFGVIYYYMGI